MGDKSSTGEPGKPGKPSIGSQGGAGGAGGTGGAGQQTGGMGGTGGEGGPGSEKEAGQAFRMRWLKKVYLVAVFLAMMLLLYALVQLRANADDGKRAKETFCAQSDYLHKIVRRIRENTFPTVEELEQANRTEKLAQLIDRNSGCR